MSNEPKKCVFCEDGINPSLIVGDYAASRVLANYFPMGRMSLLVIPKRHAASITDLSASDQFDLIATVNFCVKLLKEKIAPAGITVLLNEGAIAGQTVPHVHFHVIAREADDGLENIKRTKERMPITEEQLQEIKLLF